MWQRLQLDELTPIAGMCVRAEGVRELADACSPRPDRQQAEGRRRPGTRKPPDVRGLETEGHESVSGAPHAPGCTPLVEEARSDAKGKRPHRPAPQGPVNIMSRRNTRPLHLK